MYALAVQVYSISSTIAQYVSNSESYRQGGGNPNIYHYFYLYDGESDRAIEDWVYADEVNYFEERIRYLCTVTGTTQHGTLKYYVDNGVFIDADELNNLESMCAEVEPILYNMFINRRRLPIRLTQKQNHIDL
jgi:hypothetical protein